MPPADSNGTSDPFCEIWTTKAKIKTFHCEDTNNPIWYKVLDFEMEFNDIMNAPPIIINIYDYDDEPVLQEIDYNQLMLDLTSKVPQMLNYLESENDK